MNKKLIYGLIGASAVIAGGIIYYEEKKKTTAAAKTITPVELNGRSFLGSKLLLGGNAATATITKPTASPVITSLNTALLKGRQIIGNVAQTITGKAILKPVPFTGSEVDDIATACYKLFVCLPDSNPDKLVLQPRIAAACRVNTYNGAILQPGYNFLLDTNVTSFPNPIKDIGRAGGQTNWGANVTPPHHSIPEYIRSFNSVYHNLIYAQSANGQENVYVDSGSFKLTNGNYITDQPVTADGGFCTSSGALDRAGLLLLLSDLVSEYLASAKGWLAKIISVIEYKNKIEQYKAVFNQLNCLNTPSQSGSYDSAAMQLINLDRMIKQRIALEACVPIKDAIYKQNAINYIGSDFIILWYMLQMQVYIDISLQTNIYGDILANNVGWNTYFNWDEAQAIIVSAGKNMVAITAAKSAHEAGQDAAAEMSFLTLATKLISL